ncbi:MAG: peptide chain release factor N(5)-glutamine methyltransferase [Synergistetes bacterium]|nr:peptide chain release factor N(5)-glutamine methyltransferase [Synergistota bacterium]
MRIRELVKWSNDTLQSSGNISGMESLYIVGVLLGVDRANLIARMDESIDEDIEDVFRDIVSRRCKGEPLQYILGFADFWGMKLRVSPGVFIPRADTEVVVEVALKYASLMDKNIKMIDVGTGSGNIAIAVAKELKNAEVFGLDISTQAVELAKINAKMQKVDIGFFVSDMFSSLPEREEFDVIVSNPPYIPSVEIEKLSTEVKGYEPISALDGGVDGARFYRQLFNEALFRLAKGGILVVEIDPNIEERLIDMLDVFERFEIHRDLSGNDRALVCWR